MATFSVFSAGTGEWLRGGTCPSNFMAIQAGAGEVVVEGQHSGDTHYLGGETIVAYTNTQRAAKAARPTWSREWSNVTMAWADPRSLAEIRADHWVRIKAQRDAAITSPKSTSIGQFDADPDSQNNLNKVIALVQIAASLGQPAQANYTLATNARVSLTLAQLQTAALEMGAQVQALYDQADGLRQQIEAAQTKEAVEAVTWPS